MECWQYRLWKWRCVGIVFAIANADDFSSSRQATVCTVFCCFLKTRTLGTRLIFSRSAECFGVAVIRPWKVSGTQDIRRTKGKITTAYFLKQLPRMWVLKAFTKGSSLRRFMAEVFLRKGVYYGHSLAWRALTPRNPGCIVYDLC